MRRAFAVGLVLFGLLLIFAPLLSGCSRGEGGGERQFISVGTAPVGGAFYTVGSAVCEVVNDQDGDANWRVSAEATGGSMENIRLLTQGKMQFAMSNSSITYFAVRGEGDWEQAHEARAVMTLFPNIAMFVTLADSGLEDIASLRGKRVFLGPEGAGFEYFVNPILQAHGLSIEDIEPRYGSQQSAVDLLGDGAVDAAMIGGGIPNPALAQMAQANPIKLIPYDAAAREKLIESYSFFQAAMIPGGTYAGLPDDQPSLNVGSAHLITHASVADDLVYEFTKRVYENREQIAERHRAAKGIKPETVANDLGTEFHPGAIRYYQEMGLWATDDDTEAPLGDAVSDE
ncbi:TAXI family TRAP transporter solute-binding subunit [Planctomycetaceae bacterium SH139]